MIPFRTLAISGAALLAVGAWGGLQTWRLDRAHKNIAAKNLALERASDELLRAAGAIRARDLAIVLNADGEAMDARQTATFWKGQCRAAFDAGYASRRCAAGEPDGVRDLRTLQSAGAYAGSAIVPVQPRR